MSSYAAALRTEDPVAAPHGGSAQPVHGPKRTVAVIDTNAVVRGMRVERLADDAVTVPGMLAEVRDAQSRQALAQLPFGIETREPDADAVAAVRRFATLTGDAAVLSGVDTQLLALALTLERQAHGSEHLRDKPPPAVPVRRSRRNGAPRSLPGWDFVPNIAEWEALERAEAALREAAAAAGQPAAPAAASEDAAAAPEQSGNGNGGEEQHVSRVLTRVQALALDDNTPEQEHQHEQEGAEEEESDEDEWQTTMSRSARCRQAKRAARAAERAAAAAAAAAAPGAAEDEEAEEEEEEEEEGGEDEADAPPEFVSTVSLVTADFAMQNVAIQMGLRLVAPDGLRITRLQRWVLRCHACGGVSRDTARHFCARCGNAALQRVSLSVDAQGVEHVGVRKRFNLRGTRYSLPAPKGGRYAVNPVLREDQLAMKRLPSKGNRGGGGDVDVFAAEFGHDTVFERPDAGAAPSLLRAGTAPVVGRMRNPNARRHVMTNRRK